MMNKKIKLNIIPSVDTSDIVRFIEVNSGFDMTTCCEIFSNELDDIRSNYPDEIKMINEDNMSKVIVGKLKYDGWIKRFTFTQEISENYYILFTN